MGIQRLVLSQVTNIVFGVSDQNKMIEKIGRIGTYTFAFLSITSTLVYAAGLAAGIGAVVTNFGLTFVFLSIWLISHNLSGPSSGMGGSNLSNLLSTVKDLFNDSEKRSNSSDLEKVWKDVAVESVQEGEVSDSVLEKVWKDGENQAMEKAWQERPFIRAKL